MQHAACATPHTGITQRIHTQLYALLPVRSCKQPCAPSCSHRTEIHSNSSSTVQPPAAATFSRIRHGRRRCICTQAWFGSQGARQLWGKDMAAPGLLVPPACTLTAADPEYLLRTLRLLTWIYNEYGSHADIVRIVVVVCGADYKGSYVRKLSLEELQLLHRLSFGHRNQRSYLIVLYQPDSKACQEFEAEVRLLHTCLIL